MARRSEDARAMHVVVRPRHSILEIDRLRETDKAGLLTRRANAPRCASLLKQLLEEDFVVGLCAGVAPGQKSAMGVGVGWGVGVLHADTALG